MYKVIESNKYDIQMLEHLIYYLDKDFTKSNNKN